MNENINLVEILKNYQTGTELYSSVFGELVFIKIINGVLCPILCTNKDSKGKEGTIKHYFMKDGKYAFDGECVLFPSKDQRDWSTFKVNKPKFDPKTLQPFDKVLVRGDSKGCFWKCSLYSHYDDSYKYTYCTNCGMYKYCIPYNEETEHLIGTSEEAPEYYRYWEE